MDSLRLVKLHGRFLGDYWYGSGLGKGVFLIFL